MCAASQHCSLEANLQDVCVGQLFCAGSNAVQHEGKVLMVLLPDGVKDAILPREAGGHIIIDVSKLGNKAVGIFQDLFGVLVSILASGCQLGTLLQQWGGDVLNAHADLLLHALLVSLSWHCSCTQPQLESAFVCSSTSTAWAASLACGGSAIRLLSEGSRAHQAASCATETVIAASSVST